jgi:hypothetical protein
LSHALLAEDEGKTSPDPCWLYFEKRDYYYGQEVDSYAAPIPDRPVPEASQVEPGHPGEGGGPES